MLELGCRQNMTGMETKRGRGKYIANALLVSFAELSCLSSTLNLNRARTTHKTPVAAHFFYVHNIITNLSEHLLLWIYNFLNRMVSNSYKKLSYCWETVRRESMPRIAEIYVEMTT